VKKSKFGKIRKFNGRIYEFLTRIEKEDEEKLKEIKQQFREKGYINFRIAKNYIYDHYDKALYGNGKFDIE
jgi:hypothetical protein